MKRCRLIFFSLMITLPATPLASEIQYPEIIYPKEKIILISKLEADDPIPETDKQQAYRQQQDIPTVPTDNEPLHYQTDENIIPEGVHLQMPDSEWIHHPHPDKSY